MKIITIEGIKLQLDSKSGMTELEVKYLINHINEVIMKASMKSEPLLIYNDVDIDIHTIDLEK